MNKDILKFLNGVISQMVSDDAPTKIFVGCRYEIRVSPNPGKVYVKDFDTGKTRHMESFNDLEISLLSLVSSICMACDLYNEEDE